MRKDWRVPLALLLLLCGLWLYRWDTVAEQTIGGGSVEVHWIRDRWTGRIWLHRYVPAGYKGWETAHRWLASSKGAFWVPYLKGSEANCTRYAEREQFWFTIGGAVLTTGCATWLYAALPRPAGAVKAETERARS